MTDAQTTKQHQGKHAHRGTDSTDKSSNQGIVDGRPMGSQPTPAPVTLDTVIDSDASVDATPVQQDPLASSTLIGATSKDVYRGLGVPPQGMSSKELHHDGQPGRKRHGEGIEQFGEGEIYEAHKSSGTHKVDGASERRFIATKEEFEGKV
ncbi:hypothetical protein V8B97DRAFT_1917991 [Scleroderma yunnanense]